MSNESIVHPDGTIEYRDGSYKEAEKTVMGAGVRIKLVMYKDDAHQKRREPHKEEIHDPDGRTYIKEYD